MIYIGTQYYRAPTPDPDDWDRDIRQAREYGLDYIRAWLMWNWYSRREGTYDFSSLRRLLDTCDRHGMKAIMLVNLESVPAWLVRKCPEAVYRDATGGLYLPESVGNTPAGGFPGLCFHHDAVVDAGREYIVRVASEFRDHPAIECWEPHNEPMFEPGRYNDHFYCYCERTVEAFRDYLRRKYRDLDALNAEWRRNYGEFEEVQPPRRRGIYNDWLDWRAFALDHLIDTLQWRVDAIRAHDPNHYVMMHTRGGSGVTRSLAKEGIDDYRMAPLVDKYGTAAFPQCGPEHEYFIAMAGARCAAKGKEYWMAELQAGPYGMGVHRNDAEPVCEFCGSSTMEATIDRKSGLFDPGEVTPERLKMWSWSGIAQGAKGVVYWQYRNESFGLEYGFGLTELDGSPHARLEAVREFHNVLRDHEGFLDGAAPAPAEIAIAWDPTNDVVNWTAVGCTDAVKNSIKGMHKVLWHGDYPVDIARLDLGVVDDDLSPYRIVYLPFSPRVSSASAKKLKDYVRDGGTLITVASAAQFDDTMRVANEVPGQGLAELFGARRADVRTMHAQRIPALKVGRETIPSRMHKEILRPAESAKVLGTFATGEPAVVENHYGRGKAIYIGTNPFMAYCVESGKSLLRWVHQLNREVRRPAWTNVPDVVCPTLVRGDAKLVFLLNTLPEPTDITLTVRIPKGSRPGIEEWLDREPVTSETASDGLRIHQSLGPYGTKVFQIAER